MADNHDAAEAGGRSLDATGEREVVYCHQCENEWYRDSHGLICPRCEGEITEIISPESDPRHAIEPPIRQSTPPGFASLQSHNPWARDSDDSDPEVADIEEHIEHNPNGSVHYWQSVRRNGPERHAGRRRNLSPENDPDHVMRDFQSMIGNLMGPQYQPGEAGRSGPETLFTPGPFGGGFRTQRETGPQVYGGRFTFTTTTGGGLRPRDPNGPQPEGSQVHDLASLLGGLFGPMGPMGQAGRPGGARDPPGVPSGFPGLQGLFAAMLNPANARSGDAVYTQEALDQIISTLMEQHPTSNAPGPASAEAIAALPKSNLSEKQLGPEGKGECSVCMDDIFIGDEVVNLPCTHWFHETCARMWLNEHNTCPICRKGIDGRPPTAPGNGSRRSSQSTPNSHNEPHVRRLSSTRPHLSRDNTVTERNRARLDAIRASARVPTPAEETPRPRRYQVVGNGLNNSEHGEDLFQEMPGSYNSHRRTSEMSDYRRERDLRRGHTSGSDTSRDSHRSFVSGSANSNGGPMSWFRERFGGGSNSNNRRS